MSELHEVAFAGDLVAVENCLVKKGLNPSEADPGWGDRTPLHLACGQGHKKCVLVLLNAGAAVNAVTDIGWTPGHFACETGKAHCLSTLLSNGLDLDIKDYAGDTAQRVAEIYGQTECLQIIEEHVKKKQNQQIRGELKPPSPNHRRRSLRDSSGSRDRTRSIGTVKFKNSPGHSNKAHDPKLFSNPEVAKKSS